MEPVVLRTGEQRTPFGPNVVQPESRHRHAACPRRSYDDWAWWPHVIRTAGRARSARGAGGGEEVGDVEGEFALGEVEVVVAERVDEVFGKWGVRAG